MGQNKKNIFRKDDVLLAEFARVLSHPARIAILRHLAEKNTCICGEIVDILPLAQSTVSQQLKELKNAGLIAGEIDGPRSCYCINKDKYNEMIKLLNSLNTDIVNNKKGCC